MKIAGLILCPLYKNLILLLSLTSVSIVSCEFKNFNSGAFDLSGESYLHFDDFQPIFQRHRQLSELKRKGRFSYSLTF